MVFDQHYLISTVHGKCFGEKFLFNKYSFQCQPCKMNDSLNTNKLNFSLPPEQPFFNGFVRNPNGFPQPLPGQTYLYPASQWYPVNSYPNGKI